MNKMRVRSSGILNMFWTAFKNFSIYAVSGQYSVVSRQMHDREDSLLTTGHRPLTTLILCRCFRSLFDLSYRAAGFFDLVLRGLREAMRRDLQPFREIAVAEDHEIVLRLFYQAAVVKDLRSDLVTSVKILFDLREADLDPLFLKDISEPTLRQTTLQRHLSALEPGTAAVTGARFLALMAAAGRLPQPRARTASHPLFLMCRAFRRLQIIK